MEEQSRKQLGHIHDFIMRTICEVDVGRGFLYAAVAQGVEGKTARQQTLELMVANQVFLCAGRLLEKRSDALGLKDLKRDKYLSLIGEAHIRDRILALVDEGDMVGKPLRGFRNKWLAHMDKVRSVPKDFNASATAVMQIAKEINILLCEARGVPCLTVDQYLEASRTIRETGGAEHQYVW